MPKIIKNGQIIDDDWQILKLDGEQTAASLAWPDGNIMVPMTAWLERKAEILSRSKRPGVWLDSHEDVEAIAGDLEHFVVIGLNFPKFTDGRAYSTARLLRERYAYRGEIRAIGDVLQDQLFYMKRCGIDAFALREGKDIEAALSGLRVFSETYQAAVDQPQPLFRRRTA
ncbi:DUF934 domain-containing protein [Propionivibrio sp.]|uniref:DUF934 domain-containing protein n=1 Tax=Propionivibrio sp. TaxID=2212460 RepID=UPI0025FEC05D|nr:DUF934 domain-containing protein [Propionivibrio sp.]MBK7356011.1 DUF934 domain-containing protein [Propionivibrio sp.]MBK8400323.1 DUF934 domain-containing protein [Propionivibrio sp.]MBK8743972.1 DUF934 domain-containing protein [Propionivibrio sp.]MBK8892974.1 DUF934 domain-containing protein [Propionivibrio sp.]MBL0207339.1 DUF934 domain-containing protein [Propionivibrio sp.]